MPSSYRDGQVCLRQQTANMRGHVVGPFRGMGENRIAILNQSRKKGFHVHQNRRIGVLTDDQRRARVANKHVAQTRFNLMFGRDGFHHARNVRRHIVTTTAAGLDKDLTLGNQEMSSTEFY